MDAIFTLSSCKLITRRWNFPMSLNKYQACVKYQWAAQVIVISLDYCDQAIV